MKRRQFFLLIIMAAVAIPQLLHPQSLHRNESGRFYMRNFGYKEYDAHQQNWAIVQDVRGIIYVGNNWGILEYDGASWRHIVTDKNSAVIAVDIDPVGRASNGAGTIYVGAEQGLGYLAPDSTGLMQFVSLEPKIPEDMRDFADVWRVHATRHGVYFFTVNRLLLWANNQFRSWKINAHSYSQEVDDTIYYADPDAGLMQASGGEPYPVQGGELFKEMRISTIFPFGESRKLLVGTRSDGLFLQNGDAFAPFKTEADQFFRENMIYSGTTLQDDRFAFGTIRGGVAVINKKGEWLHKLDKSAGLRDQTVIFCFEDEQGGLWLSFLNGIAHVEIAWPLSRFTAENGLEGGVESICRHQGMLYAATHSGVFYLQPQSPASPEMAAFEPVAGIAGFVWELFTDGELLLAANDDGVFEIRNKKAYRVSSAGTRAFTFYQPENNDQYILVGLTDGLAVLKKEKRGLQNLGCVRDIQVEIRSIAGDGPGRFWLGTNVHGAILVDGLDLATPPKNGLFDAEVSLFAEDKLPVGEVNVFNIANRVLFGTERGIRYFDREARVFRMDSTYGSTFADTMRYIGRIAEDGQKRIWIFSRKNKRRMFGYVTLTESGEARWLQAPFQRIQDVGIIYAIYPEAEGAVWIGGTEGIARYFPRTPPASRPFMTNLRRVTVAGDSVIFAGKRSNSVRPPILPFAQNRIRFEYAAAAYDAAPENLYQFRLEGFEDNWSPWINELKKDYTNLHEGEYTFRIRARNIYGEMSEEDGFKFRILSPWYRSWLAYFGYGLIFVLIFAQLNHLQIRRQRQKAAALLQRQRERARLREAELRAEAAEAERELEKEQIRSRIASDLHDEVGSNLSSISITSQILLNKSKLSLSEKKRIGDINTVARLTAESMRDIIWFVNPVNDSMQKLVARMRETANVMLDHIEFKFSCNEHVSHLITELGLRRNLYLIYKEALQNIVKHANAANVEIALDYASDGQTLTLSVKDDGRGFETQDEKQGNGLKNFGKRAQAIGGELRIDSMPGRGTTIVLAVKLP